MKDFLKGILEVQELDIKMMRLMKIKKQRLDQLAEIRALSAELNDQFKSKKKKIEEINEECTLFETKIEEHKERIKKLESQQGSIKKIEEFNAITKEIQVLEKEKTSAEQTLSDHVDDRAQEEELLEQIKASIKESNESGKALEEEIYEMIRQINTEGTALKQSRDELAGNVNRDMLLIYEKLLRNKKSRVVVPLENRVCTGCHIALTPQHENLVRKGDKTVYCEHCSRIHFWAETAPAVEAEAAAG